jgi:hypothetical protein
LDTAPCFLSVLDRRGRFPLLPRDSVRSVVGSRRRGRALSLPAVSARGEHIVSARPAHGHPLPRRRPSDRPLRRAGNRREVLRRSRTIRRSHLHQTGNRCVLSPTSLCHRLDRPHRSAHDFRLGAPLRVLRPERASDAGLLCLRRDHRAVRHREAGAQRQPGLTGGVVFLARLARDGRKRLATPVLRRAALARSARRRSLRACRCAITKNESSPPRPLGRVCAIRPHDHELCLDPRLLLASARSDRRTLARRRCGSSRRAPPTSLASAPGQGGSHHPARPARRRGGVREARRPRAAARGASIRAADRRVRAHRGDRESLFTCARPWRDGSMALRLGRGAVLARGGRSRVGADVQRTPADRRGRALCDDRRALLPGGRHDAPPTDRLHSRRADRARVPAGSRRLPQRLRGACGGSRLPDIRSD